MPSRMPGSGRDALQVVQEWAEFSPNVYGWSAGPPGCPGVVGRPYRTSGIDVSTSRMSGTGRETLLDVREWSVGRPGFP